MFLSYKENHENHYSHPAQTTNLWIPAQSFSCQHAKHWTFSLPHHDHTCKFRKLVHLTWILLQYCLWKKNWNFHLFFLPNIAIFIMFILNIWIRIIHFAIFFLLRKWQYAYFRYIVEIFWFREHLEQELIEHLLITWKYLKTLSLFLNAIMWKLHLHDCNHISNAKAFQS